SHVLFVRRHPEALGAARRASGRATAPLSQPVADHPLRRALRADGIRVAPYGFTHLLPGFHGRRYDGALHDCVRMARNRCAVQAFKSRKNVLENEALSGGEAQGNPERRALFALTAAGVVLFALSPLGIYFLFAASFEGFVAVALVQGAV